MIARGEWRRLWRAFLRRLYRRRSTSSPRLVELDPYAAWLNFNRWTTAAQSELQRRVQATGVDPGIVVVIWPNGAATCRATRAVQNQAILREARVIDAEQLPAIANRELVVVIPADDALAPNALAEFVCAAAADSDADLFYCDDDSRDSTSARANARFKAPEGRLWYPGQVLVARGSLSGRLPWASADFDSIGRVAVQRARRCRHIPLVLHHRTARDETVLEPGNPSVVPGSSGLAIYPHRVVLGHVPKFRAMMYSHNLSREGATISQLELTRGLVSQSVIDASVYAFHDGPMQAEYRSMGIHPVLSPADLHDLCTWREYDHLVRRLADEIRRVSASVVYANTLKCFPVIDAASRTGIPSIWNVRESEPWQTYFNYLPHRVAQRALECLTLPYRVVFVSNATQDLWSSFNASRNFCVIRNGIQTERFLRQVSASVRDETRRGLDVAPSDLLILSVGTLCERKNQLDLVASMIGLPAECRRRVRVVFVGDEIVPYANQVRDRIHKAGLGDRFHFIASTTEVSKYYAAADIFVLCSHSESYPRVILEAMLCGLATVSTPTFGVTEQLTADKTGVFYAGGSAKQLSAILERLVSDPMERARLGAAARGSLNQLMSFDHMVDMYGAIFRQASLAR